MNDTTQYTNTLAKLQNNYQPNPSITKNLHEKNLVLIVGPAAIGKSSVMNKVVELSSVFKRVSGFTTRQPRNNDESELYDYLPHTVSGLHSIVKEVEKGELVQFAVHPTTYAVYATRLKDYPGTYNMLDTLFSVVDGLRTLPFKEVITIGLITPPNTWKKWLLERYPLASEERAKRLKEAILSLSWLLEQPEGIITWSINEQDQLEQTAKEVVEICFSERSNTSEDAQRYAHECIQLAKQLLEEDEKKHA